VEVVYNGVDLLRFAAPPPADPAAVPVIGFCGVFRPEKQLPVLIEAFAQLRRQGLAARLLLVGDGPTMPECRARTEQCGVTEDVTFAGEQADVRAFLRRMDVFVLPSRNEAMPVALLEAMAMERAVVASNVGGIPEVIVDGESGLLTPSGDMQRLGSALAQLVTDPTLRRQLGIAARQRVEERFSLDAMMGQYAAI
jgi:glycosyltransferase involved in cell wall biosynthesis